ncbi:MAG: FtsQ-type POTRA domain-containing protein [Gammaproteobacteria bacterium]|nr:FtsQ-type POTRA domain-containing protein [Gammaproteobacteria bacterium]
MSTYPSPRRKPYQKNQTRSVPPLRLIFLSLLAVILAFALLVGGRWTAYWMQKPTSFPIRNIELQGNLTHVSPQVIQKIMRTQLTGGFFSLHVSAAKNAILAFPWIADVSFRRLFPDTLTVRLHEQQAVARFGKTGVLNTDGVIFYPDIKTIPQNLPDLEGPVDQSQALLNFYQTANTLVKLLGLSVVDLRVTAENSWTMTLSNQLQVSMGRQNVLPRLKQFIVIYPKIAALSHSPMMVADLRYANGVAVQYDQTQADKSNSLKK